MNENYNTENAKSDYQQPTDDQIKAYLAKRDAADKEKKDRVEFEEWQRTRNGATVVPGNVATTAPGGGVSSTPGQALMPLSEHASNVAATSTALTRSPAGPGDIVFYQNYVDSAGVTHQKVHGPMPVSEWEAYERENNLA